LITQAEVEVTAGGSKARIANRSGRATLPSATAIRRRRPGPCATSTPSCSSSRNAFSTVLWLAPSSVVSACTLHFELAEGSRCVTIKEFTLTPTR
jgi:hypothetical protein